MGLFKNIFTTVFGDKKDLKTKKTGLLSLFTPYFSSSTNPELNDTFMAAVNTHAIHLSKIKPRVYLNGIKSKQKKYITRLLCESPNKIMEAGTFWEKVAKNYYTDNNVFIYLDWDPYNVARPLRNLWILDPLNIDLKYDKNEDEFYFKFVISGEEIVTNTENIIHLARNVDSSELFGERNKAIDKILQIINTNYDGIENAVKSSAVLRFVINTTTMLKDKDREKKAKEFAETYLAKDGTGVAYLDASSELTQIKNDAKYANAEEMKLFENKIKRFLNINDNILSADFTEDQWQAYYESALEPIINKLQNELNRKIFTNRERDIGNEIVIDNESLQVISTKTKISMIKETKELGLMSLNEYRGLLNMPPIDGGDKRLNSLNYISSEIADEYQLKDKKNEESEEDVV